MKRIEDLVNIPFFIPPMADAKSHHVISRGQSPRFYKLEELRDRGEGKTKWVDSFEKTILGLYLALNAPVPYAFYTPDKKIRSLDAGCLKMLVNRNPSDLIVNVDQDDYIDTVVPSQELADRYNGLHDQLRNRIVSAGPD